MRHSSKPDDRKAIEFMGLLYMEGLKGTGHSWTRLNGALAGALIHAIEGGMQFTATTFTTIYNQCNGGYWFGTDPDGKGMGQRFYPYAVEAGNTGAMLAYETFAGFPRFIWCGRALYPGRDDSKWNRGIAAWAGFDRLEVTSIAPGDKDTAAIRVGWYDDNSEEIRCKACGEVDWKKRKRSASPKKRFEIPWRTLDRIEKLRLREKVEADTWRNNLRNIGAAAKGTVVNWETDRERLRDAYLEVCELMRGDEVTLNIKLVPKKEAGE